MIKINEMSRLKKTAVLIMFLLSFFWIIFGILNSVMEKANLSLTFYYLLPGLLFIFLLLISLKYSLTGGIALIFAGISFSILIMLRDWEPYILAIMLITFSVAPLISGILFVVDVFMNKQKEPQTLDEII